MEQLEGFRAVVREVVFVTRREQNVLLELTGDKRVIREEHLASPDRCARRDRGYCRRRWRLRGQFEEGLNLQDWHDITVAEERRPRKRPLAAERASQLLEHELLFL